MRCVLYIRVSTDEQATSVTDQRNVLTKHAAANGYKIAGEYVDEGISGDATEKRRAFQAMMKDCSKKRWELILCWDQDRFGRFDPLEAGYWIKPMRDAGVVLETIGQGRIDWNSFASRIVWSVNQEAKHGFLRDLARNSLRGSIERAKSGKANGRNPYGYTKGEDGHYILGDASKVEAVRRVFKLRTQGNGYRLIALNMNNAGIPSPGGGQWSHDSVRLILERAEVYSGTAFYGRRHRGKYATSKSGKVGDRGCNKRENPDPVRVDNAHPPIISPAICKKIQDMRELKRPPQVSKGAALAGLLKCGRCSGTMYWRSYAVGYLCGTYVRGHGCGHCFVPEQKINDIVEGLIRQICGGSLNAAREDAQKRFAAMDKPDVDSMHRDLASLDQKITAAMDRLLIINARLVPELETKIFDMRERRDRIAADIKAASHVTAARNVEVAAERLWELTTAFAKFSPTVARSKFKAMFESIQLDFVPGTSTKRGQGFDFVGGTAFSLVGGQAWKFSAVK